MIQQTTIAAVAASAVLAAPPGSAGGVAVCEEISQSVSHDFGEAGHRKHNDGFVSYAEFWSFQGTHTADLVVVSCKGNRAIRVGTFRDGLEGHRDYDVQKDVDAAFESILTSPRAYRPSDMVEEFARISPEVALAPLPDQPCACAMAYPHAGRWAHRYQKPAAVSQ